MTQTNYGGNDDRNELFLLGAAAGALVATVLQELLERRRQTPLERAQARAEELAKIGGKYARSVTGDVGDYLDDLAKQGGKQWNQTKKAALKQAKQSRKQADTLVGDAL